MGGVAQLGERRVRNAKVGSSILLVSTNKQASYENLICFLFSLWDTGGALNNNIVILIGFIFGCPLLAQSRRSPWPPFLIRGFHSFVLLLILHSHSNVIALSFFPRYVSVAIGIHLFKTFFRFS